MARGGPETPPGAYGDRAGTIGADAMTGADGITGADCATGAGTVAVTVADTVAAAVDRISRMSAERRDNVPATS